MSSTIVHSKQKNNPVPVFGQIIPTDRTVEIPPKTAKWGVSEKEVIKSEELGEIVFSPVGNSRVKEDGTLEMQDGTIIPMANPEAYKIIKENMMSRVKDNKTSELSR